MQFPISMNQKLAIGGAIAIGIAAIAGTVSYFSPYFTVENIKKSAADRDAEALVKYIDFPSLRTSVKENVKNRVMKEIEKRAATDKEATTAIGQQFVEKTVNPTVDKILTPEGISALIENRIPEAEFNFEELEQQAERSKMNMGYESLNRFAIHITDINDPDKKVIVVLKRDGLAWKLSEVDIS